MKKYMPKEELKAIYKYLYRHRNDDIVKLALGEITVNDIEESRRPKSLLDQLQCTLPMEGEPLNVQYIQEGK